MQIACKCKYCGKTYLSEDENDLHLEIDFANETIMFVCREKGCKKHNIMNLADSRKTQPLPGIIGMRG
jgi:hypothetical protein